MAEQFANAATTTLNGSVTNSTTTFVVTSASTFPTTAPFRIRVKAEGANTSEICTVTAGAGTTTWTVVRASETYAGSSSASAHASGAVVEHILTAGVMSSIINSVFGSTAITSDYSETNTSQSIGGTTETVVHSKVLTSLAAGTYAIWASAWVGDATLTPDSGTNAGNFRLRAGNGTSISGTSALSVVDTRGRAGPRVLFGYYVHSSGDGRFELTHTGESSTVVYAGTTDVRFGRKMLIYSVTGLVASAPPPVNASALIIAATLFR